jgi:hypothetical protein
VFVNNKTQNIAIGRWTNHNCLWLTHFCDTRLACKSSDLKENQVTAKQRLQAIVLTEVFRSQASFIGPFGDLIFWTPDSAVNSAIELRFQSGISGEIVGLEVVREAGKTNPEPFRAFVPDIQPDDQRGHLLDDACVRKRPAIDRSQPFHQRAKGHYRLSSRLGSGDHHVTLNGLRQVLESM